MTKIEIKRLYDLLATIEALKGCVSTDQNEKAMEYLEVAQKMLIQLIGSHD